MLWSIVFVFVMLIVKATDACLFSALTVHIFAVYRAYPMILAVFTT